MKKRIGELNKKPVVIGDSNLVTEDEILYSENSDIVTLKIRDDNGNLKVITGSSSTNSEASTERDPIALAKAIAFARYDRYAYCSYSSREVDGDLQNVYTLYPIVDFLYDIIIKNKKILALSNTEIYNYYINSIKINNKEIPFKEITVNDEPTYTLENFGKGYNTNIQTQGGVTIIDTIKYPKIDNGINLYKLEGIGFVNYFIVIDSIQDIHSIEFNGSEYLKNSNIISTLRYFNFENFCQYIDPKHILDLGTSVDSFSKLLQDEYSMNEIKNYYGDSSMYCNIYNDAIFNYYSVSSDATKNEDPKGIVIPVALMDTISGYFGHSEYYNEYIGENTDTFFYNKYQGYYLSNRSLFYLDKIQPNIVPIQISYTY